jgi:hypothetical protein
LRTRLLRRLRRQTLYLGERRRQQQKRCQTARNVRPSQHALVPLVSRRSLATRLTETELLSL